MVNFYTEFKLNSKLSRYIDCVWMENFSRIPANHGKSYLVVPDNTIELIFTSGTLERRLMGSTYTHTMGSHVSCLKTVAQEVRISNHHGLGVRFKPYGLYAFAKPELWETVNQSLFPSDVFGSCIRELEERLLNAKTKEEQLRLVEGYFMKKLDRSANAADNTFDYLVHDIVASRGAVRVQELVQASGFSVKTVERKFRQRLGLTPKEYCQLVRIFHAFRAANRQAGEKLSTIAYDNGFYDQMHFIREVKKYTTLTPGEYMKANRELQLPIFTT